MCRRSLLSSLVLASCLTVHAADWPSWRGPDRNGISKEADWNSAWDVAGPAKAWTANVGIGFSSMVVSEGRLYTVGWADEQDTVRCLDAVTGKVLWSHTYKEKLGNRMYEGGPNATPPFVGNNVFMVSKTGRAFCFEAATGKVRWEVDLGKKIGAKISDWGVSGSPVMGDAKTLLLAYGPSGVALEAETGRVIWDSGSGKDMTFATPVVAGDRLFISSGDDGGELLRVSGKGAERIWKNKNLSTFTGTAVLIGGMLYGHETAGYKGANQELRCVDLETGTVKWGEKGFGQGSIIAAGDRLIVLSDKGELSVVRANPGKFELLARSQVIGGKCRTSPVLAHGRLYVRNAKGDLVCLDVRPKA